MRVIKIPLASPAGWPGPPALCLSLCLSGSPPLLPRLSPSFFLDLSLLFGVMVYTFLGGRASLCENKMKTTGHLPGGKNAQAPSHVTARSSRVPDTHLHIPRNPRAAEDKDLSVEAASPRPVLLSLAASLCLERTSTLLPRGLCTCCSRPEMLFPGNPRGPFTCFRPLPSEDFPLTPT